METLETNDKNFCRCGCGTEIPLFNRRGHIRRYAHISHVFRHIHPPNYKGKTIVNGYVMIGDYFEHRLVYEEYYRCCLLPDAIVHHINGIKDDNRIGNLEAQTRRQHNFIHKPRKDMSDRICYVCGNNKSQGYRHKNGFVYYGWYQRTEGWLCKACYKKDR